MLTTRISATNSTYKENVHILFKLNYDESYLVGTAAMITGRNLPNDNIELQNCIKQLGSELIEIKIR